MKIESAVEPKNKHVINSHIKTSLTLKTSIYNVSGDCDFKYDITSQSIVL